MFSAGSSGLTEVDFVLELGFKTMKFIEQERFSGDCESKRNFRPVFLFSRLCRRL